VPDRVEHRRRRSLAQQVLVGIDQALKVVPDEDPVRRFPFSALIGPHSGISRFSGCQGRQTSRLSGSFAHADPALPSGPVSLEARISAVVAGTRGHGPRKITHLRDNRAQEVVALGVERRSVARLPSDVVSQP
jgi:hypothetical protein